MRLSPDTSSERRLTDNGVEALRGAGQRAAAVEWHGRRRHKLEPMAPVAAPGGRPLLPANAKGVLPAPAPRPRLLGQRRPRELCAEERLPDRVLGGQLPQLRAHARHRRQVPSLCRPRHQRSHAVDHRRMITRGLRLSTSHARAAWCDPSSFFVILFFTLDGLWTCGCDGAGGVVRHVLLALQPGTSGSARPT
jgi:hypothetical protein